ncbi:MAG TPA: GTP-binding protein, partial [Geminicoccaceae bacterium]|nr:GTP-binding protein [Geminicoccaceae bacterium]
VATRFGAVSPRVLLGLGAGAENDLEARPSHHEAEGDDHGHDDFESFVLDFEAVPAVEPLLERIRGLSAAHDVLRVKGFAAVTGKPLRHAVQAVADRVQGYYDRPWRPAEPRVSRLVVIGQRGLDRSAIASALREDG